MPSAVELVGGTLEDVAIHVETDMGRVRVQWWRRLTRGSDTNSSNANSHDGVCAICLEEIVPQETALVKGSEHAYCATCILRWASCKKEPTCPQCNNPFEFLKIHRALDGRFSSLRFGNHRWVDNEYVRAERQEGRPIQDSGAGPSHQPKKKESHAEELVGRRAKRALKREAADKADVAKHQQHLARLGRMQTRLQKKVLPQLVHTLCSVVLYYRF